MIPAGTPEATPVSLALGLSDQEVQQIDLQVPPGPAGVLGFALYHSGTPILPRNVGEYFVWDDHYVEWALEDVPSPGGWAVVGYNTGAYDHTIYVVLHTDPVAKKTATSHHATAHHHAKSHHGPSKPTVSADGRLVLHQYHGEDFATYDRLLIT